MLSNPYLFYVIAAFLFFMAGFFKHRANQAYDPNLIGRYLSLKDYLYQLDHSVDDKTYDYIMDLQPGYWRLYRLFVALTIAGIIILFLGIVAHFK